MPYQTSCPVTIEQAGGSKTGQLPLQCLSLRLIGFIPNPFHLCFPLIGQNQFSQCPTLNCSLLGINRRKERNFRLKNLLVFHCQVFFMISVWGVLEYNHPKYTAPVSGRKRCMGVRAYMKAHTYTPRHIPHTTYATSSFGNTFKKYLVPPQVVSLRRMPFATA